MITRRDVASVTQTMPKGLALAPFLEFFLPDTLKGNGVDMAG